MIEINNSLEANKNVKKIIVDAACDIFARYGFKKTTMDEIAHGAHIGKSSIYYYFKSKSDVFRAVVEKENQLLREGIIKAINKEHTPQKKLHTYILTRMKIFNQLANFYSAIKDEYLEHYKFIEKIREKHNIDEINIVKEILNAGVRKGVFIIDDCTIAASAIVTALRGFEYSWATEQDNFKKENSINHLLDLLFNGIVKRH